MRGKRKTKTDQARMGKPDEATVIDVLGREKLPPHQPDWVLVLTASLQGSCAAPADELILHAFDLYCDDLHAPFREHQRKLAGLHSDICTGVAQLQALAPEMVQRAMARHRIEFDHFIEDKGEDK